MAHFVLCSRLGPRLHLKLSYFHHLWRGDMVRCASSVLPLSTDNHENFSFRRNTYVTSSNLKYVLQTPRHMTFGLNLLQGAQPT